MNPRFSRNRDLLSRSLRSVWHPCTQMKHHEQMPLIPISRGDGVWLYDFDGNRYLDAVSSWWVNLFGHANPRINAAVADQLGRLEHVILAGFTHEPVVQLSERLSALTGLSHCFYGSDGASAVEIALKMSFHYWKNSGRPEKTGFVSLKNGYHGETLGALSVTDVPLFRDTYAALLRQSTQLPSPDWRNAHPGETAEDVALRAAGELEKYLAAQHGQTAALIVEPLVQAAGTMAMYHASFLREARTLCNRYGVHLIADEIAVGFGRTGNFLACEQAGIRPDFVCLSKGITGGYLPLSVTMTSDDIYRAFYDDEMARGFLHSHSYSGNALACRAALAVLDIFEQDDVIAANRAKSAQISARCQKIARHASVRQFRNTGMIWAFEVATDDPLFPRKFYGAALDRGLLLRPLGNTVYFMPPYIIEEDHMDMLVAGTCAILDSMELSDSDHAVPGPGRA
ncbi:MAG TPA: adenosylmethionine--8-amino-7-oxononanoate transaminase [Burkholderiales bacterium]|nr:adenosylmethionine--8-amino-7-oxononanoate transaminase [Burkholderiales bacterium]